MFFFQTLDNLYISFFGRKMGNLRVVLKSELATITFFPQAVFGCHQGGQVVPCCNGEHHTTLLENRLRSGQARAVNASKSGWKLHTMILKCPLFLVRFPYEVNSTKFACKSVPLSKPKPIPIVFIWLREGPLWPTFVHAQGPQLFVSKPDWHATSVVVK